MTYDEFFKATLDPLGYPVSKEPAGGQNETYIAFNEAAVARTTCARIS